jgi:hypothetical protein
MNARHILLLAVLSLLPAQAALANGCPAPCSGPSPSPADARLLYVQPSGADGPVLAYRTTTGRTAFSLPAGVSSADGRWHIVTTPLGHQTAITRFALVTGESVQISLVPGRWTVGGVSPTGRWAAVFAPAGSRSTTRLAIVDAVRGSFVHRVELKGRFEIETLSADGRRLFLIQHLDASRYLVRLYDVAHGRLKTQPLTASGGDAPMIGDAWSGVASPDGRWLLTLYLNTRHNHAFVHALDLEQSAPTCIDLPSAKRLGSLRRYTLTLSPDGRTLFAANPALGVVAAVDLHTLSVTRTARFAPSSAGRPTRALSAGTISRDGRTLYFSAGTGLWAYDAAYGVVRGPYPTGGRIVGFGYGPRDRTVHAVLSDGRMLTFAAATGRRLR